MLLGFKILILWMGLLSPGFGSDSDEDIKYGFSSKDGAFYTDDAVIITAHVSRQKRDTLNSTRDARQFMFLRPRQADEGAFGTDCISTVGKRGTCKSFRECYPLIKVADLTGWDGWVMGHYDTCSYISADNMEVFGVCCTEPTETPPQQDSDVERLGYNNMPPAMPMQVPPMHFGFPSGFGSAFSRHWAMSHGLDTRQIPAGWPPTIPPLPTHPPDHTAPTHPPSLIAGVTKPPPSNGKPPTTWATRPTTTKPTTKQTWQTIKPAQPTKPVPTKPSQPVTSGCGRKNENKAFGIPYELQDEERIVGGHNADPNEWPWAVALFNGGRQFCGGSLIDDRHVLSAAHCVAHMTSWDVARLTAKLGAHNIKSHTDVHIERKIKRVVRHRGFDMRTLYNDVAILTLDQPVQFSKTIRSICLPSGSRAYAGQVATVVGWGSLRESGPQPSILQEVEIPIWTNSECRLKYGAAAPGGIVEHMICAGRASMDSCSGDSGGPLMVKEGGTWTQVGVVSWGIGCGKGQYPGVYTRVTSFMPWIQKNSK